MDVDKSSKQADRQACRQAGPRQTGKKEGRQVVGLVSNTAVAAGSNSSTAVAAGSNSSNTAVAANFRFIIETRLYSAQFCFLLLKSLCGRACAVSMLYHFGKRFVFILLVLTGACLSSCFNMRSCHAVTSSSISDWLTEKVLKSCAKSNKNSSSLKLFKQRFEVEVWVVFLILLLIFLEKHIGKWSLIE